MKYLSLMLMLGCLACFSAPAFAAADVDDAVLARLEARKKARNQQLNDAQIFEKEMLERRDQYQKAKKKRTKRISGSSSSRKSSPSSGRRSSGGRSSGLPSLSSGMFVK